jgi:hypothetical protein
MSNKSRRKRVRMGLVVVAACIVLAGLWAVLATPQTALAKKPEVLHGAAAFRDSPGDAVRSDTGDPYIDAVDFTELGLGGFFRLSIQAKKNGGRRLDLTFPEGISPDFFPATQNIWILWLSGSIADWRDQALGASVLRAGNLLIGQTGKDEAGISFGKWGPDGEGQKGGLLSVTRTGVDEWTIESLTTDLARFYRHTGTGWTWYELKPMPFRVTYHGAE